MNKYIWKSIAITLVLFGVITGLIMYNSVLNEVEGNINNQVAAIHLKIDKRFKAFDKLLRQDESDLNLQLEASLPKLSHILQTGKAKPTDWNNSELQALAKQFNVDEIYVIDKSTTIVATTYSPDLGFELGLISDELRATLLGIFNKNSVTIDRITMSTKTGVMNKYAYFSPKDSNYIYEVSVSIKPFLTKKYSFEYVNLIFNDYFSTTADDHLLLRTIDLLIINDLAILPFIGDPTLIDRNTLSKIPSGGSIREEQEDGLTYYSRLELDETLFGGIGQYLVVRTTFDISGPNLLAKNLILTNISSLIVVLIFIYILVNTVLKTTIIRRVNSIRETLKRITSGDYLAQCDIGGDDELTQISNSINLMRNTLSERHQELENIHRTLEDKVIERTHKLQDEIIKRESAEKDLQILATTDPLTKLPNRRLIDQYLERQLIISQRNKNISAVLLTPLGTAQATSC